MTLPVEPREVAGLTGVLAMSLERVPIRLRSASITFSAWRLELQADQGGGAVLQVDDPAGTTWYRGEGVLLGWPQDALAAVYQALLPQPDGSTDDRPQLG